MSSPAPVTGPLQTRASLAAALRDLGVRQGETLLAHTSLSSLGWVCGGAVALVQALLDAVGPDGTLTVPTHSGDNSDPADWSAPPVPEPWWPAIRANMPPYDPRTTPSRGVGVVPETLRTWPGALRSAHPQTSFAALGPGARALVEGHALDCRLGEQSPLARLEEAGARVLLLGTGYASCTAFHLAEYRIAGPRVRNSFAVRTPSGPRWTTVTDTSVSDEGFAELGDDFEGSRPVVRGTVGGATARLFPLAAAVAHAERWLPVHRPRTA
ncbi:aminoglycoside N(3)-acetyltransferase [Streptomyces albidoflavus]|uniref:aminoglycoside N(3)-acetyltransferase n=2 Tax=Streptomyces albidoflavus TaxID=1886 RepID=UPI00101E5626|nr:AAC(3) family N-acetyltransferase [Streptomyces albidoflavus]RZD73780.1 AAC(3) family N-acetyltransferase [Streptomyces albidoflavus]RZD92871.1 AAC(3) family N-acetyltransferase [Streptomyces albidoflavus]RZD94842.1 AAC(3) family N-acetyltransferase [Streptomyces albidoflavus]RZD97896.1 AAC(3) family N-acetyltransferase [Streptomyces albidoflavus]